MNIIFDKEIYPLEETEMKITITLLEYNNTSIIVEKLYELIPIKIDFINNKYIVSLLLPKINFRDESGIIKIKIINNNKEIIKHIVPFRDNYLYTL